MFKNPYPEFKVSENIMEAVKAVSKTEWQEFFKSIRVARIPLIEGCLDSDLTKERGKLTMVSELESIVLNLHSSKKVEPNK